MAQTDAPHVHKPPTCTFAVVKTDNLNFYKAYTRIVIARTRYPTLYNIDTRFAVVKTDSLSQNELNEILQDCYTLQKLFKVYTRFAVVKTDYPNFNKPLIRLAVVQTSSQNT